MNLPNIFRTISFNLRAFGLVKGLHFPVYVYGRVRVHNMGTIDIKCPVKRGLIRIGMNAADTAFPFTQFNNQGTIEVYGRVWLHHGCRLLNTGEILFSGSDIISNACVFDIRNRIEFGHDVSVGYNTEFSDSDDHYMVDVGTRKVMPNSKPIRIGNFNWLGSHTFVKKGTVTPDYLIVASPNALLLKDYTKEVEPYSILGGSPAKVIGKGKQRILNFRNERVVRAHLKQNCAYIVPADIQLDDFCKL